MAYVNTFTITGVPVTCTGTGTHDWISADFKIIATANSNSTAYTVQIYARIDAGGWMEWDGTCTLKVKCNGISASANMKLAMYNGSEGALTAWDGPATFSLGGTGSTSLKFEYITIDLTSTTCSNGLPGILHVPDGGNMTAFTKSNYNITIGDGGLEPLLQAPVISSLKNDNPFNANTAVSDYTDRISLSWVSDKTITGSYYRINNGAWQTISTSFAKTTIYNLTPGTSYKVDIYSKNGAGNSNTLSTTIRTRHVTPVLTMVLDYMSIDKISYKWTSTKELASTEYRIGANGTWINANLSGTSGILTLNNLDPNTKYTVFFRGVSTSANDSLATNEVYQTVTTYNIARIISSSDIIFGESFTVNINHPSDRKATLALSFIGANRTSQFSVDVVNGNNTITFTQDQLDDIYRCFTNTNFLNVNMVVTTTGGWNTYTNEYNTTMKLTGIAKTAHTNVNGHKRAEVFFGVYNIPRRAIFWVGDENNKPRELLQKISSDVIKKEPLLSSEKLHT